MLDDEFREFQAHLDKYFCDYCGTWVEPLDIVNEDTGDEEEICPECKHLLF